MERGTGRGCRRRSIDLQLSPAAQGSPSYINICQAMHLCLSMAVDSSLQRCHLRGCHSQQPEPSCPTHPQTVVPFKSLCCLHRACPQPRSTQGREHRHCGWQGARLAHAELRAHRQSCQTKPWMSPGCSTELAAPSCARRAVPGSRAVLTVEVLGSFAAQGLERLLRVCPLQHQPAAVQVSAVAQGIEGFLQSGRTIKEIKGENQEGRQNVPPSALKGKAMENTVLGVLCSDGAGSISIRGSGSVIYLLCSCSRAHSHHHCCWLLLVVGQAGIQHRMAPPWAGNAAASGALGLVTPQHPVLC